MKTPRIAKAVEHIDDDLISAAADSKRSQSPGSWLKWTAIAACLILVVAMAFPMLNNNQWITEEGKRLNLVGSVLRTGDGSVTYHTDNFSEHILAFTLVLENEIPACCVAFSADNILNQWTDREGVVQMENELFKVITPCTSFETFFETNNSYTVVDDVLFITVNGKKATTMPTTPGTYEIVIDYSELYNRFDIVVESVDIWPFGDILINCETFPE